MVVRTFLWVCLVFVGTKRASAQANNCTFKPPFLTMHFGRGNVQDVNTSSLTLYNRVASTCPADGYYAFVSATTDCFDGDWHTLAEDHTPGDAEGNMLLVNSAFEQGLFLTTVIKGFKGGTTCQLGLWLMNVCKPSDKCPYPLLPDLSVQLQTPSGRIVGKFGTGELPRHEAPHWTQYKAEFNLLPAETELILSITNKAPGGCGNDFALDDITFSECIKPEPVKVAVAKKPPPVEVKRGSVVVKKEEKNPAPGPPVLTRTTSVTSTGKEAVPVTGNPTAKPQPVVFVPPPLVLQQRTTTVVRQIETGEGEIRIDLYDNGEIDGDTVSIYHNNALIVSGQKLSQKPITFSIKLDKAQPHHELVMVAENLGSIPPNTSLMIVTAKDNRYQVFISSTEQQNAKVVIDIKE